MADRLTGRRRHGDPVVGRPRDRPTYARSLMTRRIPFAPTLVLAAAVVVAACGGSSAPPLTDPTEIVTAALTSTEAAKSVHIDATLDGTMSIATARRRRRGRPDQARRDDGRGRPGHRRTARPRPRSPRRPCFNVTGELIVVDGKAYLKTSLQGRSTRCSASAASRCRVDPPNTGAIVDALGDFLLKPGVDPVKGDDVACGSTQCYTVDRGPDGRRAGRARLGAAAPGRPAVDHPARAWPSPCASRRTCPHHLAGPDVRRHDRRRRTSLTHRRDHVALGRTGHDHGPARRPDQAAAD